MNQLTRPGESEVEIKRSRFIARLFFVQDRDAVASAVSEARAQHPHANHVVHAYRLADDNQTVEYSVDAGEPHGTAGRPALAVLQGAELVNAATVVVRYFGGQKLGTGGLARAYALAVREALADARFEPLVDETELRVAVPFAAEDLVRRQIDANGGTVVDVTFAEEVTLLVCLPTSRCSLFKSVVLEATAGRAEIAEVSG